MNQKAVYMDNEIFETQKEQALLLDVRTEIEFKALRQIPNSINVYIFDLLQDPLCYLSDKNQLIITLCNGGNRSSEAALELRQLGYHNAYVLRTGIYGYYHWKEQETKKKKNKNKKF